LSKDQDENRRAKLREFVERNSFRFDDPSFLESTALLARRSWIFCEHRGPERPEDPLP
jgi:hypothetical protein